MPPKEPSPKRQLHALAKLITTLSPRRRRPEGLPSSRGSFSGSLSSFDSSPVSWSPGAIERRQAQWRSPSPTPIDPDADPVDVFRGQVIRRFLNPINLMTLLNATFQGRYRAHLYDDVWTIYAPRFLTEQEMFDLAV